jgi:hypothetical protein
MDPAGLALETYDAVGLYRTKENGVTIDTTGAIPGTDERVDGPVDLARKLADKDATHACFAHKWMTFAYGRKLSPDDECMERSVVAAFKAGGYNVRRLLVELTQTDTFLSLGSQAEVR